MSIKFDAAAAERLLKGMDSYCKDIQKEARELLSILNDSAQWKDNQKTAFQHNINELANDLSRALDLESDYMRTYQKRIRELRR